MDVGVAAIGVEEPRRRRREGVGVAPEGPSRDRRAPPDTGVSAGVVDRRPRRRPAGEDEVLRMGLESNSSGEEGPAEN